MRANVLAELKVALPESRYKAILKSFSDQKDLDELIKKGTKAILKLLEIYTAKQLRCIMYNNQFKPAHTIAEGAIRTGKTILMIWLFAMHINCFAGQGKKFLITGYTMSSIKKNVLDEIEETFGFKPELDKHGMFEWFGNKVYCFGTDKADSFKPIRGVTAAGWYGNEITLSHPTSVQEAYERCSAKGARIFWDTNPDHPQHFIKTNYINLSGTQTVDGQIEIKSWHFTLDDNDFLDVNYVFRLKKTTPKGHQYDRNIKGLWVSATGMIYQNFNMDVHIIPDTPERRKIKDYFAGVDWGFSNPGIILVFARDYDGNCYLVEEITATRQTIGWWCDRKKEVVSKYGYMPFYCDPSEPAYISQFGGIQADNEVIAGISHVAGMFASNKLFIIEGAAPMLLKEIWEYRWNERVKREEPIKENDHTMDAMRYALYNHIKNNENSFRPRGGRSRVSRNLGNFF